MKAQASVNYSLVAKLFVALIVALALLVGPLGTYTADAASLKASGVKFTKPGKTFKAKLWYGGVGKHTVTCSIKSVKVKKAKKAGYKTATVVFEMKDKWKPKNKQIKRMANYGPDDELVCGMWWAFIVDGKTGASFFSKKNCEKYGVTVKSDGWYEYDVWRYTATDGSWVEFGKKNLFKCTITFPNSYKDLCLGVGVGQKKCNEPAMLKFEDGKVNYPNCWWHKNNKKNTRFVSVK